MAFTWESYLLIAGGLIGCLAIGIGWGSFRLSWKEVIDAAV